MPANAPMLFSAPLATRMASTISFSGTCNGGGMRRLSGSLPAMHQLRNIATTHVISPMQATKQAGTAVSSKREAAAPHQLWRLGLVDHAQAFQRLLDVRLLVRLHIEVALAGGREGVEPQGDDAACSLLAPVPSATSGPRPLSPRTALHSTHRSHSTDSAPPLSSSHPAHLEVVLAEGGLDEQGRAALGQVVALLQQAHHRLALLALAAPHHPQLQRGSEDGQAGVGSVSPKMQGNRLDLQLQ